MSAEEPTDATPANTAQPAPPADREELTVEIERTREQLGQTVEALVAKTDVKARAAQATATVRQAAGRRRVPILVAAGAVLAAGWLLLRRTRR
jgi:hypothetical protein